MKTAYKYLLGFSIAAMLSGIFESCNAPQILYRDANVLKLVDSFQGERSKNLKCYTYQITLPEYPNEVFYLCTFQKCGIGKTDIADSNTIDIVN